MSRKRVRLSPTDMELLLLPLIFLVGGALALALFVFWVWMLIHAVQNKGITDGEKVAWVLIILFLHFLGALIYFFVGKPKGNAPSEVHS